MRLLHIFWHLLAIASGTVSVTFCVSLLTEHSVENGWAYAVITGVAILFAVVILVSTVRLLHLVCPDGTPVVSPASSLSEPIPIPFREVVRASPRPVFPKRLA